MADTRTFPDVDFIRKTANEIFERMVADWETKVGRSLGQADPIRLMIGWEASINAQLYAAINQSAKMNVPRYAVGKYLDSIAEDFHYELERLPASAAKTTMEFTLAEAAEYDTVIPAGTRVTKDGTVIFVVQDTTEIPAGRLTAEVTAICTQTGTIGNGYPVGSINVCMDPDNVTGLSSVKNLTESEGGAAEESDEAFYERMRQSQGAYSTTGARASYIYMAMSANAAVSDVEVVSPSPCCVDVYIMLKNGQIPGEQVLAEVQEYIANKKERALCDNVTVKPPEEVQFDVDVTWYYTDEGTGEDAVKFAVEEAVEEYIQWQMERMGRDINPSELIYRMKAAGAKRVEVTAPTFQKIERNQVAVIGERTVTYGGEEDA